MGRPLEAQVEPQHKNSIISTIFMAERSFTTTPYNIKECYDDSENFWKLLSHCITVPHVGV
jgi:hypothetical protein